MTLDKNTSRYEQVKELLSGDFFNGWPEDGEPVRERPAISAQLDTIQLFMILDYLDSKEGESSAQKQDAV